MNVQPQPKTYTVTLARLVRQILTLEVNAYSMDDVDLSEMFSQHEDNDAWIDDIEWGCDEGTHNVTEQPSSPTLKTIVSE